MFILRFDLHDFLLEVVNDPLEVGNLKNVEVILQEESPVINLAEILLIEP